MAIRKHSQMRRPNGSKELPVRSVRISEEIWEKARWRATNEGLTISNVMAQLAEGYADGHINPPRIRKMYSVPKPVA